MQPLKNYDIDTKMLDIVNTLTQKADELYELARLIGADSRYIKEIANHGAVVHPFVIIDLVKEETGIDVSIKSRKVNVIEAKQIVIYFLRKYTRYTLEKIAEYVSCKDHSTIHHHLRVFNGYLGHDERLISLVEKLETAIVNYYKNKKITNDSNSIQTL